MDEDKACTWVLVRSREIHTITMNDWHSPVYHRMVCFVHYAVYIVYIVDYAVYIVHYAVYIVNSEHWEIGHILVDHDISRSSDR